MGNRVRVKLGIEIQNPTEVDKILGITQIDPIEYKLLEMVQNEMSIEQMDQMLVKLIELHDQVQQYQQQQSKEISDDSDE